MEFKLKQAKKVKITEDKQEPQLPARVASVGKQKSQVGQGVPLGGQTGSSVWASGKVLAQPVRLMKQTWWLYLPAIVLAYVWICGGVKLSELGMDWGYYTVEHFIGQPSNDDQYAGAFF